MSEADEMVDVMAFDEMEQGRLKLVRAGPARVAICRVGDIVHAVSGTCTHAKIMLAPGRLGADGLVECPMHGAKFSPVDGSVRCGPATIPLGVHAVRIEAGRVLVGSTPTIVAEARQAPTWGNWSKSES